MGTWRSWVQGLHEQPGHIFALRVLWDESSPLESITGSHGMVWAGNCPEEPFLLFSILLLLWEAELRISPLGSARGWGCSFPDTLFLPGWILFHSILLHKISLSDSAAQPSPLSSQALSVATQIQQPPEHSLRADESLIKYIPGSKRSSCSPGKTGWDGAGRRKSKP